MKISLDGQQLDQVESRLFSCLYDAENRDAVNLLFDIDLEFVTNFGTDRKHRSVDYALGLLSPGGTPGPAAVTERAGEFDVDPSRHGLQRYRLESVQHQ